VEEFEYLGTNSTNQNSIQKEIKSRLNQGAESFVFQLTIKKLKFKIYIIII